jgi:peptidoglycan/LPS O-acetylase OafA/YrhL
MSAEAAATWVGLVAGCSVGLAGGVLGTYLSLKNTRGPGERAFVARLSVACWVLCLAFVAGRFLLPDPYRQLLWVPYTALLIVGVRAWNRRQEQIRREEAGERGAEP